MVVGMVLCVGCEKQIVGTVLSKDVVERRYTSYRVTIVETNTYEVGKFNYDHCEVGKIIAVRY